jgi:exonuclease III
MALVYKLMTLNINGMTSDTKIRMLEDLWKQGIDIALLQEVTNQKLNNIRGYKTYINEGTEKRGTAIATKEEINITEIKRLPTGRGRAVKLNDTWIINIYMLRQERRGKQKENTFSILTSHTFYR